MERFGSNVTTQAMTSHEYIRRALQACEGVPVTIERSAVVKLANALEKMLSDYRDASEEWDAENQELADSIIDSAEQALRAYYGDTNS